MLNFIKKIWEGKVDEATHDQFLRFGKGEYRKKAVVSARKGTKIKLNASFELVNELVSFVAENSEQIRVKGVIFSKQKLPFKGRTTAKGTYAYKVDQEFSSAELKDILDKCYYALLDCEGDGLILKVKKTLPRPKGDKINIKFCMLTAEDKHWKGLKKEFLFGLPDGKRYDIEHTYVIDKIIFPTGEEDPVQVRLKAKRSGKVIRKASVDRKETTTEKEFEA